MPALVREVILDEKAQRDGLVVADDADCFQPVFRDPVHHGCQDLVLRLPPAEQGLPGLAGIAVSRYPFVLSVTRAFIVTIDGGADEALAVVRRGIEQVPDDLLAGPAARAPGSIRKLGWEGDERGVK